MTRMVQCKVLKREAEGLDTPPHPGEIGQRIYQNVSKEGWDEWLQRQQMIINENQLNTADSSSIELLEEHMLGFFSKKEISADCLKDFAPRAVKSKAGSLLPTGVQAKGREQDATASDLGARR